MKKLYAVVDYKYKVDINLGLFRIKDKPRKGTTRVMLVDDLSKLVAGARFVQKVTRELSLEIGVALDTDEHGREFLKATAAVLLSLGVRGVPIAETDFKVAALTRSGGAVEHSVKLSWRGGEALIAFQVGTV